MNSPEFDDLLDAYFVGEATPQDRARLEVLLQGDAARRRRFVEAAQLEARLQTLFAADVSPARGSDRNAHVYRPEPSPVRRIVRRASASLHRFDAAALAIVVAVAMTGYYVVRVGFAPPPPPGVVTQDPVQANVVPQPSAPPSAATPQRAEGRIRSVDFKTTTFVLAVDETERLTFHAPAKNRFGREAPQIMLDGRRTTFDEAVQLGRKAVVTFVYDEDGEAWVWKVEVASDPL